jgi:hydrogenase-4 component E
MIFDFSFLLLFLSGLMILVENRLTRLITLLSFQGLLLIPTILKVHPINESHTILLIAMVVLFKSVITPWILFWTSRKAGLEESTTPRFGYLATAFFLVFGILIAIFLTERIQSYPLDTHRIGTDLCNSSNLCWDSRFYRSKKLDGIDCRVCCF